ncbi:hypothetical protein GCM10025762_17580 [Haloechinothrix salitolerans]
MTPEPHQRADAVSGSDEPRCGACWHERRAHYKKRGVCFACRPATGWQQPPGGWCNRYRLPHTQPLRDTSLTTSVRVRPNQSKEPHL